ncbi:MAG: HAMP domain-containing histidine kinase [Bdellovibrionales bacterium]|nr:HAMP domain-containing histidine kinase [Bdellovibrionales bacterium]
MQVSCKVSYSTLVFMERQGVQLESCFEKIDTPVEFLKDPSCWLPLEKMENLLSDLAIFAGFDDAETFYREVGQVNSQLRAWGVLDSVLKMVESPKDIFGQPERFLSYFLSPHPEVRITERGANHIGFEINITDDYPLVFSYILGAVEGLPTYMGLPLAHIEGDKLRFTISWQDGQESLFDETEKQRRQFHPEIVQSVMESLQDHQKSLEEKRLHQVTQSQFSEKDFEKMVGDEVEKRLNQWLMQKQQFDETLFKVKNDFYKMYDYFVRAQQLITLISSTARKASVKEAMRRVDWPHVQQEFPVMVESACDSIMSLKDAIHSIQSEEGSVQPDNPRARINLNELIDSLVEKLPVGEEPLKVDKHMLLDRDVLVEPESFSTALRKVFDASLSKSRRGGELRIVTRPNGRKIEIEITDTGVGFEDSELSEIFSGHGSIDLSDTQKIIRDHKGNITISSKQGEGSTYLIELPL